MANNQFDEAFTVAVDLAREVGQIIREEFFKGKKIETKANYADLVTETDQRVEKIIISRFQEKFPSYKFIGEESAAAGEKNSLTDDPTWIVDPIDGTTNFVHRFPFTCVSIGLWVNKKPEIGVVYNPILDEMYTAQTGKGAYCNGKKLSVSSVQDLSGALILSEFGSNRDPEKLDIKFRYKRSVLEKVHGIRSMGSAALSMCMVASGGAEAYAEFGIHSWDIAAGVVIVLEAGGVVTNPDGSPLDVLARRVLCSNNQQIHQQISPLTINVDFERD